jgi:hypothetical protein
MAKIDNFTHDELKKDFEYNPFTGVLKKVKNGNSGCYHTAGYLQICYRGKIYRQHRLIYFWMKGVWPEKIIDHINHKRDDNRWINLRDVSYRENRINSPSIMNSGKLPGTSFDNSKSRWLSCIRVQYKQIFLGRFDTELEAHERYMAYRHEHNLF